MRVPIHAYNYIIRNVHIRCTRIKYYYHFLNRIYTDLHQDDEII